MVDYCSYKMSGSEEEGEPQSQSGMTKAELRKSNKPIMEKRRRARINQCLDELKSLILEAMKKDPTRHSKLEKADILEMTVKHLQTIQRQQLSTAVATDPAVLTKFRSGFSECAGEVSRYVSRLENVDPVVKQRLVSHLNSCVNNLQQMAPFYNPYMPYMPERLYPEVKVAFHSDFQNGDENNNGSARIQIPNGVQLIPSRLPTGELALLVPQSAAISANFPFFPPVPESSRAANASSAFTSMHRSHSPLLSPSTSTSSYGEENHHSEYYPQSQSPNQQQQRKAKGSEQGSASCKSFSSSPDTQKLQQIGSVCDRKSPAPAFAEPKAETNGIGKKESIVNLPESVNAGINANSLRQPLSVITDKTYNRFPSLLARRDNLKRHHSDGLLAISEKRAKLHDSVSFTSSPSSSSSASSTVDTTFNGASKTKEEHARSFDDLSDVPTSSTGQRSRVSSPKCIASTAGSSMANNDMWRPW